ncbi:hypothetical protein GCM10022276_02090 [Sphingomonas limnosediminicola]|uniref:Sulfotransferase n=1 Tax=Sphingomonas limnosediminicola TaxID=940133 RepID=A0ABP7KVZ9_9SPHN
MSSAPRAEEIARDARWLAQALDPSSGMVRLIAMDSEAYRAASFLDDRILQQPVDAQVLPWPEVEAAVAGDLRQDARWIFHIGHVGSTLVSRLLGELNGVLAVREPRLLRDLALSPAEVRRAYVETAPKLMSRTFSSDDIVCVKATSFVSEIAPELVPAGERALMMYATPRNYIGSILAGENSVQELRMLAPSRAERLSRRVSSLGAAHSDAELAAIAWACEMTALEAAADAMPDRRVEWADFDRMLDDMPAALARIAGFLGVEADEAQLDAIATGPLMRRYSKAMEYDYSAGLRRDLIDGAASTQRQSIDGALAMLRSAAEKSPILARALSRAEG